MKNKEKTSRKITVDLSQSSFYHGAKEGILRPRLHNARMRLSYQLYKRMLSRYTPLESDSIHSIVEVGCGPGYLLGMMEGWFPRAKIIGLDYDPRLIDEASERTAQVKLIRGNAEDLPFADAEFLVFISLHLIEHLYHPERMIDEAYRMLKSDGVLIFATPNPNGFAARCMGSRWGGWRKDHVSLKSPSEWGKLLRERGFAPLSERTTLLSGIPAFRKFPLVILNWGILLLFGSLPWNYGEAYVAIWRKDL